MEQPGCVICEYVIHELQQLLGQNKSEEAIEKGLEDICNRMPASVEAQCNHLVETYGPAIVEILSRGVEPKDVCTLMRLCSDDPKPHLFKITQIKTKQDNCALCQYAMGTLFQILGKIIK